MYLENRDNPIALIAIQIVQRNILIITVEGLIEIPNAISPNGDNINDYLSFASYGIDDFSINIFNRWGTKVYTFIDKSKMERKFTGEALPGVYFVFNC